jgi:hypothetical protein
MIHTPLETHFTHFKAGLNFHGRTLNSGQAVSIMKPEVSLSPPSDFPIVLCRINDDLRLVLLVFIYPWADKEILLLVAIIPFSFCCSTKILFYGALLPFLSSVLTYDGEA